MSPTTTQLQLHLLTPEPGTALHATNGKQLLYDGHITDFNFPTLDEDESALLQANPDIFMNHHFYQTKLPRNLVVGITSIFPYLCALGGSLLHAILECLKTTLPSLLFTILSQCEGGTITAQRVVRELLLLINERGAGHRALRRFVEFSFAHVSARQERSSKNLQFAANGLERVLCLANGATLFRNTFDIPRALDEIHDGMKSWRSISTRSTRHNFVVYCEHVGSESKTLKIIKNVAIILAYLTASRSEAWILSKFGPVNTNAARGAIADLLKRRVLCVCRPGHRNAQRSNRPRSCKAALAIS